MLPFGSRPALSYISCGFIVERIRWCIEGRGSERKRKVGISFALLDGRLRSKLR